MSYKRFANNRREDREDSSKFRINNQITSAYVLLIKDEVKLGVISLEKAKKMARDEGLDLVEVSPAAKPPVCRILDYGKFKYDQSLKEKENKKKQKTVQPKFIGLKVKIADHDLNTKITAAKKFLESDHKVHFNMIFSGREKAHKDLGLSIFAKILDALKESADVQSAPKLEENKITCILIPKKAV